MGGQDLTPKAKEKLKDFSDTLYISNTGMSHLMKHFKELERARKENKLLTKENDRDES